MVEFIKINTNNGTCSFHRRGEIQSICKCNVKEKPGVNIIFKNNMEVSSTYDTIEERDKIYLEFYDLLTQ